MKTKEIKVWVSEDILSDDGSSIPNILKRLPYNESGVRTNGKDTLKATLIIELPEKKIELTESQFDELVKDIAFDNRLTTISSNHISSRNKWYRILFGGENDN